MKQRPHFRRIFNGVTPYAVIEHQEQFWDFFFQDKFKQAIDQAKLIKGFAPDPNSQYLAEELIEVGRNMRDHNYLNYGVADWFDELEACTGTNVVCDIADYSVAPLLTPCTSNPGGVCGVLDNNQGQFRSEAGTGDTTTFERGLTITKSADGQQAIMTATVRWKQKNLGRVYVLQTSLANWQ